MATIQRRGWLLGLLLAVIAGGVAWFTREARPPRFVEFESVPREAQPPQVSDPELAAGDPPRAHQASPSTTSISSSSDLLRVTVLDASTNAPVAGAEIVPVPDLEAARLRQFSPKAWIGVASTGGEGIASLPIPFDAQLAGNPGILARAPGYETAHARWPDTLATTVRLEPLSAAIAGLVSDGARAPLAGATVMAIAAELPLEQVLAGTLHDLPKGEKHVAVLTTTTDAAGRFSVPCANGKRYRLIGFKEGWYQLTAGPPPAVQAPSQSVVIQLSRVRMFNVRFIDAATRKPLSPSPPAATYGVFGTEGLVWGALDGVRGFYDGARWRRLPLVDESGVLEEAVLLDDRVVPEPTSARLLFSIPWYQDGATSVRLFRPDAVHGLDEVVVTHHPAATFDRGGTVLVNERNAPPFVNATDPRILRVSTGKDWMPVRGIRRGGAWEFANLPIGLVTATYGLGHETSEPMELDLTAGEPKTVTVDFGHPAALSIELVGPDGATPLYDADVLSVTRESGGGRASASVALTSVRITADGLVRPRLVVPPGRYIVSVFKQLYGWKKEIADVQPQKTTVLRLVLDDPGSLQMAPPGN